MVERLDLTCPHCGASNNAYTPVGNGYAVPESGDAVVCAECHEPSVLEQSVHGTLVLRTPTVDEYAAINAHPEMHAAREGLRDHPGSLLDATAAARRACTHVSPPPAPQVDHKGQEWHWDAGLACYRHDGESGAQYRSRLSFEPNGPELIVRDVIASCALEGQVIDTEWCEVLTRLGTGEITCDEAVRLATRWVLDTQNRSDSNHDSME